MYKPKFLKKFLPAPLTCGPEGVHSNGTWPLIKSFIINSGAFAREARAAEHHGEENVVNYPYEKIW